MSVQSRTSVTIADDDDGAGITVEPRDADDEHARWQITASGGGTTAYVTSADLIEFASAIRALVDVDPFEPTA